MLRKVKRVGLGDLPDIVRAYRHLVAAGLTLFILRKPAEAWLPPRQAERGDNLRPELADALVRRASRWTNTAARYPFPWARCLQRSLALCYWLEGSEIRPALKIGVRKNGKGIDAHAWVIYRGQTINDSPAMGEVFSVLGPGGATPQLARRDGHAHDS